MADHLRKQIRVAAAATVTGLSTTGANVFTSRARALQASDLPCLSVYCDDESIEIASMDATSRRRKRTLSLHIEGRAKGNTAPEDVGDQIAKEVEIALDTNNTLGGLVKYIEQRSIRTEFQGDGDEIVVIVNMDFEVVYYSSQGAPDVPQ